MKHATEVLPAEIPYQETAVSISSAMKELTPEGNAPIFEAVKAVTRPVLSFGAQPEFIRIESLMRDGEVMEKSKYKSVPKLLDVINLRTGEPMLLICATVFILEMEKSYPKGDYVGKDFQVRKIKTPEKDYSLWAITEIKLK
jgi:hypothetical protein